MEDLVIYWVRKDFRIKDNKALLKAVEYAKENDYTFLPIFILDYQYSMNNYGYFRQQYLAKVLSHFSFKFNNLPIFTASSKDVFTQISKKYKTHLFINELIEPNNRKTDVDVSNIIKSNDGKIFYFKDQILVSKDTKTGTGNLYSVFTPFKKNVWKDYLDIDTLQTSLPKPKEVERSQEESKNITNNLKLQTITYVKTEELLEKEIIKHFKQEKDWTLEIDNTKINLDKLKDTTYKFPPHTEKGSLKLVKDFISKIDQYNKGRDMLAEQGTSKISIALSYGIISPITIISLIKKECDLYNDGVITFISELIWREFYKYILFYNPETTTQPFLKKYIEHPITWDNRIDIFEKYTHAQTGYKIIDASIQQLNQTGWMHNRARMIVSSFLTKNLGIDWRWGEKYFQLLLLDYDPASNIGGWQWGASVGADPKPIRIFNPFIQAEKFDPKNNYIETWLKDKPDFPEIVDYKQSRQHALDRYKTIK